MSDEVVEYTCMGLVISKHEVDGLLCNGWVMVDITNAGSVCREVMLKMADSEPDGIVSAINDHIEYLERDSKRLNARSAIDIAVSIVAVLIIAVFLFVSVKVLG